MTTHRHIGSAGLFSSAEHSFTFCERQSPAFFQNKYLKGWDLKNNAVKLCFEDYVQRNQQTRLATNDNFELKNLMRINRGTGRRGCQSLSEVKINLLTKVHLYSALSHLNSSIQAWTSCLNHRTAAPLSHPDFTAFVHLGGKKGTLLKFTLKRWEGFCFFVFFLSFSLWAFCAAD